MTLVRSVYCSLRAQLGHLKQTNKHGFPNSAKSDTCGCDRPFFWKSCGGSEVSAEAGEYGAAYCDFDLRKSKGGALRVAKKTEQGS